MARPTKEQQAAKQALEDERVAKMIAKALETERERIRVDVESQVLAQLGQVSPAGAPVVNLTHPQGGEGDKGFVSALALAIANLSAQGTNKAPYVSPDTMEGWAMARDRMMVLIVGSRAKYGETQNLEDLPKYRLVKAVYLNEMKIEPLYHDTITHQMADQRIWWDEVPSEAMEPDNDIARAIFTEFKMSIGEAPIKEKANSGAWARTQKGTLMGVKEGRGGQGFGAPTNDPRVSTAGAPTMGKHVHLLGTVAHPAVVR